GRHVFDGDTVTEQIHAHARQTAPSLAEPGNRQSLDAIFRKMVRKSPEDRYQTMAELVAVLKKLRETQAAPTAQVTQAAQYQPASTPHSTEVDVQTVQQSPDGLPASRPVRKRRTRLMQARRIGWFSGKSSIIVSAAAALLVLIAVLRSSLDHDTSHSPNGDGNTYGVAQDNPGDNRGAPYQSGFSTGTELSFNGESSYVVAETLKRRAGDTATLEAVAVQQESRKANVISWLGPDWMALFSHGDHWGIARRVGSNSHLIVSVSEARSGQRTHLAGMWDGENLHLFINGVPAETRPLEFQMSETSGGLYIGGVPQNLLPPGENDRFFNGLVEAVRISNGVRYTTGFDPGPLEPDSSPLALYHFNQVQGQSVPDASHHGHAATIVDAELITD
ncbi:MAG: LamG-like jellyroll fold domain-containing protein, partial [Planctomycetaceae bacterium]